jgi:arabinofuranosyltransferase
MPGGPYRADGLFDPPGNSYGLFDPETTPDGITYRWTTSHAALTFPYAANLGRYAEISLRLGANRAPGQTPAKVNISLNGKHYLSFTAADAFQVYSATLDTRLVPNPYLDPAHVQVDIESTTISTSQDPRQLGVALDWVQLQPRRSSADFVAETAAWAAAIFVLLWIACSRLGVRWGIAYGLAAIFTFAVAHLTYMPRVLPLPIEIGLAGGAWVLAAALAPREQPIWGAVLALCGLWTVFAGRLLRDWQMDDAYISYRYAWNLAHGHGLVYNLGETPVEGYSNFLWTLPAAAAIAAGLPLAGAMLTGTIVLGLALLALTYFLGLKLAGQNYLWPLLAVVLLSVDVSIVSYGARGSGMESILFAFLVLASVALLWYRPAGSNSGSLSLTRAGAGVALALASLTRPEGLFVAGLLIALVAVQERGSRVPAWRSLAAVILPYLLIIVPYHLWRLAFYGYPFPNTFYTKTDTSLTLVGRGLAYCWEFVTYHPLVLFPVVVGIPLGLLRWREQARARNEPGGFGHHANGEQLSNGLVGAIAGLALLVLGYTLYIIWVGGDHFPAQRFFVPLLAPIVLLSQETARTGLARLLARRPVQILVPIAVLVTLTAALAIYSLWLQKPGGPLVVRTTEQTWHVDTWGTAGLWLRDNTAPQALTAAQGAGAIAYYSQRGVVDMFGLTDLHIGHMAVANMGALGVGHEKQDPAYVLDRKPDYVLSEWEEYFLPVAAQLNKEYEHITVRSQVGPNVAWLRRVNGR